ncbi:hypothetical protein K7T73_13020 [Bacillus badius]|nr:hypothetical protein K7T73_13020 [Bacillus badius]
MDIYDYAEYPKKEDWLEICKDKVDSINKLSFNISPRTFDILNNRIAHFGIELNYQLKEFNNRAFDLITNYTMLKAYYEKGIPDDEWYAPSEESKARIQYFPQFEEKHYANLYWFSFYSESYYTRFFGLIDSLYHLVNTKYKFEIEPKLGFINKVLKKLEVADKGLYDYLKALPDNNVYKKVSEFRNNLVHNFRPNQIDSGITTEVLPDGRTSISVSVGRYTTSNEFLENIHDSLDLLADIIDNTKDKLEGE